jgi:hypothetical protein
VSGNDYPINYRGQVIRLAEITTTRIADGVKVTHYFATEETDYAGQHYVPWLVMDEAIHRYRSLQVDDTSIKLVNVDAAMEALLWAERWEGAETRLLDYFTNLGEGLTDACELLRGVLTERQANEREITWRVIPSWDPSSIQAPPRSFTRPCSWKFKSASCGYVSAETTCDKTLATCTLRGQQHRFNGFLQANAYLSHTYPAGPSGGATGGAGGSTGGGQGRLR